MMIQLNQMTGNVDDIMEETEMVSPERKRSENWKHFKSVSGLFYSTG